MELALTKISETTDSTLSVMTHAGKFLFFVIEDGYREVKEAGQTRIPAGKYELMPRTFGDHFEKYAVKFRHTFAVEVKDVPGFTNILIHIGNTTKDTQGCLLPNYGAEILNVITELPVFRGMRSTEAYLDFVNFLTPAFEAKERVWLMIER